MYNNFEYYVLRRYIKRFINWGFIKVFNLFSLKSVAITYLIGNIKLSYNFNNISYDKK